MSNRNAVSPLMTWDYRRLLAGLRSHTFSAIVTVDDPLPAGTSSDEALLTLAWGERYVLWKKTGGFSETRTVDTARAVEIINAGAMWSGDESDNPAS